VNESKLRPTGYPSDMASRPGTRRADYAALTRQAIIEAGYALFADKGYFATRVEDIAREAKVAVTTVYTVVGGKAGLIRILIDRWSQAPLIGAELARLPEIDDPDVILRRVARSTRAMREEHGDLMRLLLATAPHDEAVADGLRVGTERYRAVIAAVVERLDQLGGLGVPVQRARDILWFYFGFAGYFTLVDENHWSLEESETWLLDQTRHALRG
jgi:AcrR family transcriptional regulator